MESLARFTNAPHNAGYTSVVFNDKGDRILSAGNEGKVLIFNAANIVVPLTTLQVHSEPIRGLAFSPAFSRFATCSDDRTILIYSFPQCELEGQVGRGTLAVNHLAFSPCGNRVYVFALISTYLLTDVLHWHTQGIRRTRSCNSCGTCYPGLPLGRPGRVGSHLEPQRTRQRSPRKRH